MCFSLVLLSLVLWCLPPVEPGVDTVGALPSGARCLPPCESDGFAGAEVAEPEVAETEVAEVRGLSPVEGVLAAAALPLVAVGFD